MDTIQKAKQVLKRGHELSEEVVAINGIADELYEMRKNNDETLFQLKNIAGSLDLVSQYLYDISWELKRAREEKTLDKTTESWENTTMNKTQEDIEWQVNMWDGNMNIFEIYDELRDGYTADEQEALLNHAYDTWHYNDLIAELASHFGVTLHNYEPKLKRLPL